MSRLPLPARKPGLPLSVAWVAFAFAACAPVAPVAPDEGDDDDDDDDEVVVVDPAHFVLPADAFPCEGGAQCFFVDVAVDPDVPDGEHIQVRAALLPATGAAPLGVLAVNFGGFGVPGVPNLQGWAASVPELHENFHVLAWDPRGSGESTPLTCTADFAAVLAAGGPASTLADAEAQIEARRVFLDRCRAQHGAMIDHMGYRAHAHDLDAVRAALDVERLNYLGYSGGTALGQVYAEFFPTHVNRVAWDSALVAHGGARTMMAHQAPAGAVAIDDFAAFCAATDCGFSDPAAVIEDVLAAADAGTLLRANGAPLTWLEAAYGIVITLYAAANYPTLVDALGLAQNGDGGFLEQLANAYNATATSGSVDPSALVYFLTNCAEELSPTTAADALAANLAYSEFSPLGPVYATDHTWCAALGEAQDPLGRAMTASDVEQRILILQSVKDLATPLAAGEEVAANVDNSRFVIHDGVGHTPSTFNRCMANVLDDYLVNGVVPDVGTHCAAE